MSAAAIWWALLGAAVLIEVVARFRPARVSTLDQAAALVAGRIPGRVILMAFWVFVGVHLFARYTIPSH
jgi:hypothetical protein